MNAVGAAEMVAEAGPVRPGTSASLARLFDLSVEVYSQEVEGKRAPRTPSPADLVRLREALHEVSMGDFGYTWESLVRAVQDKDGEVRGEAEALHAERGLAFTWNRTQYGWNWDARGGDGSESGASAEGGASLPRCVHTITLAETPFFAIVGFVLPAGAVIPLHDHPGMSVSGACVEGQLRMRLFHLVGQALPEGTALERSDTPTDAPLNVLKNFGAADKHADYERPYVVEQVLEAAIGAPGYVGGDAPNEGVEEALAKHEYFGPAAAPPADFALAGLDPDRCSDVYSGRRVGAQARSAGVAAARANAPLPSAPSSFQVLPHVGNVHEVVGTNLAIMVDVLAPPYDVPRDPDCHFYQKMDQSADGALLTLRRIPRPQAPPRRFRPLPYKGIDLATHAKYWLEVMGPDAQQKPYRSDDS